MDHLFISDVHLGAFNERREKRLRQDLTDLIDYCSENTIRIHIHGDLFDYWMEYPHWRPGLAENVLKTFSDYMNNNGPVNFVTGNHDNWTQGYFEKLGFSISEDFFDLRIDDKRLFVHHGDGLSDPGLEFPRPAMHRILRNNFFVKVYQTLLPPAAGIKLMQLFSNYSKRRAYCSTAVLDEWSEKFLNREPYDAVISGHDHQPRIFKFESGIYINTGSFFEHRTVGMYTSGRFELVVWNAAEHSFTPYGNRQTVTEPTL